MKVNIRKIRRLYVPIITLAILILSAKGITKGDFWFSDEANHAMDGVFIYDIFRDMPISHLYDYCVQYYGRYPAVTLGYYPPFFPFIEALFFGMFGVSVTTARVAVVFMFLLAGIFWYRLISKIYNTKIGFYSTMLFITTPFVVKWSRAVMLEIPVLAMIILSCYLFYNFVELNKRKYAIYFAIALSLSVWTKQTAVFMFPVFLSYILIRRKFSCLIQREALWGYVIIGLLLVPLLAITIYFGDINLAQSIGNLGPASRYSIENWTILFSRNLRMHLTLPVLILGSVGIVITIIKKRAKATLFLLWILWCYIVFSYIANKVPRYSFVWIPPFCLFATLVLANIKGRIKALEVSEILLVCLSVYQFTLAYRIRVPYISGYDKAAKYVVDRCKIGLPVLFDGYYSNNFIFHVRRYDPEKEMVVLRGSKVLATFAISKSLRLKEYVHVESDIFSFLDTYGIKYVIVEDKDQIGLKAFQLLRQALRSPDFELLNKIPIQSDIDGFAPKAILIYEYKKDVSPKKDFIILELPTVGRNLTIPIKRMIK